MQSTASADSAADGRGSPASVGAAAKEARQKKGAGAEGVSRVTKTMEIMMLLEGQVLDRVYDDFQKVVQSESRGLSLDEWVGTFLKHVQLSDNAEQREALAVELKELFDMIDVNGDGELEWNEFVSFCVEVGMGADAGGVVKGTFTFEFPDSFTDSVTSRQCTQLLSLQYDARTDTVLALEDGHPMVKFYPPDLSHPLTSIEVLPTIQKWAKQRSYTWKVGQSILWVQLCPSIQRFVAATATDVIATFESSPPFRCRGAVRWTGHPIRCTCWHPAVKRLMLGDSSGCVTAFNIEQQAFGDPPMQRDRPQDRRPPALQLNPSSNSAGLDPDAPAASARGKQRTVRSDRVVLSMCAPPDTDTLVVSYLDHSIVVWDASVFRPRSKLHAGGVAVRELCYSPGNELLCGAVVGGSNDAYCWDLHTPAVACRLQGHCSEVLFVKVLPSRPVERFLTMDMESNFMVWDVSRTTGGRGMALLQFAMPPLAKVVPRSITITSDFDLLLGAKRMARFNYKSLISSDEPSFGMYNDVMKLIFTGAATTLRVWNAVSGELEAAYGDVADGADLTCACFDDRQRKVIVGTHTGHIVALNCLNGAEMKRAAVPHQGRVSAIAYSTPTRCIITAGWDRSVRVYHEEHQDELKLLRQVDNAHDDDISAMASCHVLNVIATGSAKGSVRVWGFENVRLLGDLHCGAAEITGLYLLEPFPLLWVADAEGNLFLFSIHGAPFPNVLLYRFRHTAMETIFYNKVDANESTSESEDEQELLAELGVQPDGTIRPGKPPSALQRARRKQAARERAEASRRGATQRASTAGAGSRHAGSSASGVRTGGAVGRRSGLRSGARSLRPRLTSAGPPVARTATGKARSRVLQLTGGSARLSSAASSRRRRSQPSTARPGTGGLGSLGRAWGGNLDNFVRIDVAQTQAPSEAPEPARPARERDPYVASLIDQIIDGDKRRKTGMEVAEEATVLQEAAASRRVAQRDLRGIASRGSTRPRSPAATAAAGAGGGGGGGGGISAPVSRTATPRSRTAGTLSQAPASAAATANSDDIPMMATLPLTYDPMRVRHRRHVIEKRTPSRFDRVVAVPVTAMSVIWRQVGPDGAPDWDVPIDDAEDATHMHAEANRFEAGDVQIDDKADLLPTAEIEGRQCMLLLADDQGRLTLLDVTQIVRRARLAAIPEEKQAWKSNAYMPHEQAYYKEPLMASGIPSAADPLMQEHPLPALGARRRPSAASVSSLASSRTAKGAPKPARSGVGRFALRRALKQATLAAGVLGSHQRTKLLPPMAGDRRRVASRVVHGGPVRDLALVVSKHSAPTRAVLTCSSDGRTYVLGPSSFPIWGQLDAPAEESQLIEKGKLHRPDWKLPLDVRGEVVQARQAARAVLRRAIERRQAEEAARLAAEEAERRWRENGGVFVEEDDDDDLDLPWLAPSLAASVAAGGSVAPRSSSRSPSPLRRRGPTPSGMSTNPSPVRSPSRMTFRPPTREGAPPSVIAPARTREIVGMLSRADTLASVRPMRSEHGLLPLESMQHIDQSRVIKDTDQMVEDFEMEERFGKQQEAETERAVWAQAASLHSGTKDIPAVMQPYLIKRHQSTLRESLVPSSLRVGNVACTLTGARLYRQQEAAAALAPPNLAAVAAGLQAVPSFRPENSSMRQPGMGVPRRRRASPGLLSRNSSFHTLGSSFGPGGMHDQLGLPWQSLESLGTAASVPPMPAGFAGDVAGSAEWESLSCLAGQDPIVQNLRRSTHFAAGTLDDIDRRRRNLRQFPLESKTAEAMRAIAKTLASGLSADGTLLGRPTLPGGNSVLPPLSARSPEPSPPLTGGARVAGGLGTLRDVTDATGFDDPATMAAEMDRSADLSAVGLSIAHHNAEWERVIRGMEAPARPRRLPTRAAQRAYSKPWLNTRSKFSPSDIDEVPGSRGLECKKQLKLLMTGRATTPGDGDASPWGSSRAGRDDSDDDGDDDDGGGGDSDAFSTSSIKSEDSLHEVVTLTGKGRGSTARFGPYPGITVLRARLVFEHADPKKTQHANVRTILHGSHLSKALQQRELVRGARQRLGMLHVSDRNPTVMLGGFLSMCFPEATPRLVRAMVRLTAPKYRRAILEAHDQPAALFTPEQKRTADNLFDKLDADSSGAVSLRELLGIIASSRAVPRGLVYGGFVKGLMSQYDEDHSGELDRAEFLNFMAHMWQAGQQAEDMTPTPKAASPVNKRRSSRRAAGSRPDSRGQAASRPPSSRHRGPAARASVHFAD